MEKEIGRIICGLVPDELQLHTIGQCVARLHLAPLPMQTLSGSCGDLRRLEVVVATCGAPLPLSSHPDPQPAPAGPFPQFAQIRAIRG